MALTACLMVQVALGAEPGSLAKYLHSDANCVLAIDVRKALETPLAGREGWGKSLETAFVDRSVMLPPEAELMLAASTIRPDRGFESDASVAVLQLARPFSLATIARANGGHLEQLRGQEVIEGIGDTVVAALDKSTLGIFTPASRQLAGRWLSDSSAGKSNLSPFFSAAVARAGKEHQIVLAIDLEDMVSADDAEKKLKASGILKGTPYETRDIAALLQSAKGIVVEVSITTETRATARLEFSQPVKASAAVMKKIVQQVLQDNGMHLDELDQLMFNVSGQSVTATTPMSKGGLRRILSLLDVPAPTLESADATASTPKTDSASDVKSKKSQAYFRTVVSLLDDLRGDRSKQDPRGGQDAVWMDKYAQKIDRLPVLDVDEEILDWGAKTAQTLRVMAGTRRDAGLSAGSQKSGLRTGVYFDSYYGTGSVNSATATAKDSNQIDTQTGNVATSKRVEGWRLIDNATADIRKKSTQRYGVEF
jgi:hypothetical protein